MVRCQVRTKIEGKEKLLVSKLDSLIKRSSKKKVKKPMLGHVVGEYYLNPDITHVKNENICTT
jgi:hypothetical protein